jgi:putative endonuclease
MAEHNDLGKLGEELAAAWLVKNGYTIQHRNWKSGSDEIDIIATKPKENDRFGRGDFLHFIEVKTRKHSTIGYPENAVNRKKFKTIQRVANHYLRVYPGHEWIQYDVLAITVYDDKEPVYFLIKDIFL